MLKIDLEKKILDKIKSKKIEPKSKVFFILKNIIFWFFSFLFILFGAISFASVLYKISGNFKILETLFDNKLLSSNMIFYLIPYFWIALLILFIYLSLKNYKQTNFFYRRSLSLVILAAFSTSLILGSIFFYFGLAQKTEEISVRYLPFYNKHTKIQELRKRAFVTKMQELGITKNLLLENPDFRKKVEDKFDKNVLGKIYLYRSPEECLRESFVCESDEIFFQDDKGCGCREIYFDLVIIEE